MEHFNSKSFSPEEVEKGLHLDLIKYLLEYNSKAENCYEDIHITTDGYCLIVEWCEKSFDEACQDGGFEYVDYNQVIMTDVRFPDKHHEYLEDDEMEERANEWLEENKEEFSDYKFDKNIASFYTEAFGGRRFV